MSHARGPFLRGKPARSVRAVPSGHSSHLFRLSRGIGHAGVSTPFLLQNGAGRTSVIYSVRHITTFLYEPAVRESVMELRLQPRSDARQRCLKFHVDVDPGATIMEYRDFMGNTVHHFDIAESHGQIKVTSQALVEVELEPAPRDVGTWADLDAIVGAEDHWEMLLPSQFAQSSERLEALAQELNCVRRDSPLKLLLEL